MKILMTLLLSITSLTCIAGTDVTLKISASNGSEHVFTRSELMESFPKTTFSTFLPWYAEQQKISGVRVLDLINYFKVEAPESITLIASDSYVSFIQISDIIKYDPVIAYQRQGTFLTDFDSSTESRGAFWLVYNLKKHPEINNAAYQSQMAWKIVEIFIQ